MSAAIKNVAQTDWLVLAIIVLLLLTLDLVVLGVEINRLKKRCDALERRAGERGQDG